MDMNYIDGRSFVSQTTGVKDEEHGTWEITVVMSETLSYPNGTIRQEYVESKAKDVSFDVAHKTAMRDVLQQLEDLVYSRGFDSLIEGLDYQRNLEAVDDSQAKADEITPS